MPHVAPTELLAANRLRDWLKLTPGQPGGELRHRSGPRRTAALVGRIRKTDVFVRRNRRAARVLFPRSARYSPAVHSSPTVLLAEMAFGVTHEGPERSVGPARTLTFGLQETWPS
jgi:hypothetical protein